MEFGLLGPLEVSAAGQPLAVGGARARAVLGLLLVEANRVVPADTLAELVWPHLNPDRATANLQVRVSELRRALRSVGEEDRLESHPPGYRLRVHDGELDALRFDRLAAAGRDALMDGDAEGALARLEAALSLWRGVPLADIDGGTVATAERARLEEVHVGVQEARIDALLALGRHQETIGELETLTADHPLRERFWHQRLLALYRSGRQAEALRAYQQLRSILVSELGIEPSPELRELEAQILQQDPGLLPRPSMDQTLVPQTRYVDSGGVHIAYQVIGEGATDILFVPGLISHVELAWGDPATAAFYLRLAAMGRLILFDKRDTGLSDRSSGDFSLEQRIDDAKAVMEVVGSRRAIVFGYSEGAPMAILFAATYPEKVSALILGSAFARWLPAPDYPCGPGAETVYAAMEDIAKHRWGQGDTIEWFAPSRAGSPDARRAMGRLERMATSPSTVLRMLGLIRDIDVRAALPTIHVPTLVIHRRGDRINPPFHGRYIAEHISGARYFEQPGDHVLRFAEREELDSMFAQIQDFLDAAASPFQATRALTTIMLAEGVSRLPRLEAIQSHGGVVRTHRADRILATFDAPGRAIRCALALRDEAPTRNAGLRAGIHTGEVDLVGDQITGPSMSVAEGLFRYAQEGEILVSRTVKDLVVGSEITFADRGSHMLTTTNERWALFSVYASENATDCAQIGPTPAPFTPPAVRPAIGNAEGLSAGAEPSSQTGTRGHPAGLPVQLTSFVGRRAEVVDVKSLVRAGRLVTLTGAGGCGKSRLGLEVVASLAAEHAQGSWMVELAPLGDPMGVAGAIASALHIRRHGAAETASGLAAAIGQRDLLVLLDNCEHLLSGCAEVVDTLLRACPKVTFLATSREPLAVPGEIVWRVPSLSFPERATLTTGELSRFEAVQLFTDRARSAGFALSEANAAAVGEICARLDGIPLAIELAAARARVLTVEQIAAALDDRFGLLTGGARTVPRQQTLEACIGWSYELLQERERRLLRRLAVFSGGFTMQAAEAVGPDGVIGPGEILDLVIRLAEKSLILPAGHNESGGGGRFRMLETIKEYAARQLAVAGQSEDAAASHLDFFVDYARRRPGERDEAYRERLRSDEANLRQALTRAAEYHDARLLELATAMVPYWSVSTHLAEARQWLLTALSRSDNADPAARARALGGLAHVAGLAFDFPTAKTAGTESLAILRQLGDKPGMVVALTSLGFIAAPLAEPDSGTAYLTEAVALAEELGDRPAQVYALALIGRAAINQPADRDSARVALRNGIELARQCGDRRGEGTALGVLGVLSTLDCDPDEAIPLLDRALPMLETHGDAFFLSLILVCQVHFLGLRGDSATARAACDRLDQIADELGAASLYYAAYARGWAAFCDGNWLAAIQAITEQLTYPGPVGLSGMWIANLAWAELLAGYRDRARQRLEDFLAANDPARVNPSMPLAIRALIARADNDLAHADDLAHRAVLSSPFDPFGRLTIWACLAVAAAINSDLGDHEQAARLVGAADRFAHSINMTPLPAPTALLEHAAVTCRAALESETFATAIAQGATMSLSDAADYFSRRRGPRHRPIDGWTSLTPAELKVVAAVAEGLTNPQIAARLFIARRTVTTHLTSIFRKLGVSTRAELAAVAVRHE